MIGWKGIVKFPEMQCKIASSVKKTPCHKHIEVVRSQGPGKRRDVAKVFNRREYSNDSRIFGPKAHSRLYLWGYEGMSPREILKMRTLGDVFSLILGAKSRAFRTDFYQVTFV